MKKDIILAGVGGQGIVSVAAIIGLAASKQNLYIKQSEVHGMSQRGGDVMSNLRISSSPIYSDLIAFGGADLIISFEPLEAIRHIKYLKPDGWLITNTEPIQNMLNYPDLDKIFEEINRVQKHITINATEIATKVNAKRSLNVVMLGASANFVGIDPQKLKEAIVEMFQSKGQDIVEQNLIAFEAGLKYCEEFLSK